MLESRMRYLFAIPAAVALLFCTLMLSGPHRREQTWVLAPQQEAASMKFAVEHETLRLLGATGPVRVTLEAPDGKLFQASQSKQYTFRTEPSQRHAWRFDWLDATTRRTAGYSTLRMTTQTTTQAGLRSNEQPVRQGKHNTHVHSYYWFDAHDTQTRMRVNVGEYRNPGDAYFRITGRAPSFDVVLDAPAGEAFAWPQDGTAFENNQEGKGAPANARTHRSYTLAATSQRNVVKFWFVDGNGLLYRRNIGVQYVQP